MKHKFSLALKFLGTLVALQNSPCLLHAMFSDETAEWCSGSFATELAVVSGGIAVAYAGYRIEYTVRAQKQQERNRLAASGDLGNFVLYLRPFVSDGKIFVYHPEHNLHGKFSEMAYFNKIDIQELLVLISPKPLVAIGKEGVNFGPGRIESHDKDWFDVFKDLATRASLIMMMPAYSEGTFQEIKWLYENDMLHKCRFIMPPAFFNLDKERVSTYWYKTRQKAKAIGVRFPLYRKKGAVFCISKGRPKIILRPLVRHWEVLDVEGLKKLVSAGRPGKLLAQKVRKNKSL